MNGTSCRITTNLESALRHLRTKGYARLWVDAVCINQDDKAERSQQLLWMGSIYRRAKEVVAWVGDEDGSSTTVMESLASLDSSLLVASSLSNLEFDALVDFLERPYWRRIWIIQELALAKHTTIQCGTRQMDWTQLVSTLQFSTLRESLNKNSSIANAKNLIKFHQDASRIKPVRFLEALKRSSKTFSTDPRDKVFALLGLVYDGALYIPVPNYRQSVQDICIGITLSAASTTSTLDIVPLLGSGCDNSYGLPSWCPFWLDLNDTCALSSLQYLTHGRIDERVTRQTRPNERDKLLYKAARGFPPKFLMRDTMLQIQGNFVDEVQFLLSKQYVYKNSPELVWSWSNNTFLPLAPYRCGGGFPIHNICHAIMRHISQGPAFTDENFFDLDYTISILGESSLLPKWREDLRENVKLDLQQQCPTLEGWFRAIALLVVGNDSAIESRLNRWRYYGRTPRDVIDNLVPIVERELQTGQLFMVTPEGFVGWAHPRARPGDQIYIVSGCTVPVILRKREDGGFVLVGDAYVQEVMEGEVIEAKGVTGWTELEIH